MKKNIHNFYKNKLKRLTSILLMLFAISYFYSEEKIQPLKDNEIFMFEYNKGLLDIFKSSGSNQELLFTINTSPGAYQLSKDRRQVIIYLDEKDMFYLLNGDTGEYKELTMKPSNSMSSFDLKYIIWQKNFGSVMDRTNMPVIVITDLTTNQDIYEIEWNELEQDFKDDYSFGYLFIRSDESDYDFIVYAKGEGRSIFGMMKINIEKKIVIKDHSYPIEIPDYPNECYGE